jgi:hypothetical protein
MVDTSDEEENNKCLVFNWAAAERIAATYPVVARLIADIDAKSAAEDAARESAKERTFNRGRILFKAKRQLNVRG